MKRPYVDRKATLKKILTLQDQKPAEKLILIYILQEMNLATRQLRIKQDVIASDLKTTRQMINRNMKKLQTAELLKVESRRSRGCIVESIYDLSGFVVEVDVSQNVTRTSNKTLHNESQNITRTSNKTLHHVSQNVTTYIDNTIDNNSIDNSIDNNSSIATSRKTTTGFKESYSYSPKENGRRDLEIARARAQVLKKNKWGEWV